MVISEQRVAPSWGSVTWRADRGVAAFPTAVEPWRELANRFSPVASDASGGSAGTTGARRGRHRLRRSAATIAWEGHADLTSIQTMLGHEDVKTTVKNYMRPADELLRPASDYIDIDP